MARKPVNFLRPDPNVGRIRLSFSTILNPGRIQAYRYQNGNSKSLPWLQFFLQSNRPAGRLGEARQSGSNPVAAELAVCSKWVSIF